MDSYNINIKIPEEYLRKENEKTQDYIRRILPRLYEQNFLTEHILERLQDEDYCKKTFGLDFPMLKANERETYYSGHCRYWKKFRLDKYFVCNHWWLSLTDIYTAKIYSWLERLFESK